LNAHRSSLDAALGREVKLHAMPRLEDPW